MHLIDYTHPEKIPPLRLGPDRRSSRWYVRLDELPREHPYHYYGWALFRYPEWLEGGSAWVQAKSIHEDLLTLTREKGGQAELRPVVGSADPEFDEALAQGLLTFGWRPLVADLSPRKPAPATAQPSAA